ncbi:MAG TPA: APC family permease [Micromonosporaceae bacterium]|nr:APC family permease [Micromonosporaceae bacterium]
MTVLARRLGTRDAVVIGLGSMLGAGVFVVFAPATALAGGRGMLLALALAGLVAACNATSSARLATRYPESGGTYVYGRERLGPFAGFLAGWGFVVGKTASCAAMALTIGAYLAPRWAAPIAVCAVLALTVINLLGVAKTAQATRVLVAVTVAVLVAVVVAGLVVLAGPTGATGLTPSGPVDAFQDPGSGSGSGAGGWRGVLGAAGLMFFAFAGYARIATLGEEVRDPQRTIARAVALALGMVLITYLVVGGVTLAVLGEDRLAGSAAPLAEVAAAAEVPGLPWAVRTGAAVAVLGVLLALLAGVARTVLAMARRADLPVALSAVDDRRSVPWRAQLAVGVVVAGLVAVVDLRSAIGFSSCTVLVYYAITNAAALTLEPGPHPWALRLWAPRLAAAAGLVGCAVLVLALPGAATLSGLAVLVVGALWYVVRRRGSALSARRGAG